MMTMDQIEGEIRNTYLWFAEQAPGVVVREEGRLAQLWAAFDRLIRLEDEQ